MSKPSITQLPVEQKRALLSQLLQKQSRRTGELPLSFAQQRLWFLDQLEPNSPRYNIPIALHINGELQLGPLEQALDAVLERHEILRTTFPSVNGRPLQRIAEPQPMKLPIIDFRRLPQEEREARLQRGLCRQGRQPFDLAQGPLFRAGLWRLSPIHHVLFLNLHHIIADLWSLNVLLRELGVLYEAFSSHRPSPLPKLPMQYADFALWQRRYLQGELFHQQLAYWKRQLEPNPPGLDLTLGRSRPVLQTDRGARLPLRIPTGLTAALKRLSRDHGVTLFMTLLAAFKTLLFRYTGQGDVTVGTPVANRNQPELEGLIGFFANTLVLRTQLSGHSRFDAVLARIREAALSAYDHQDLPFEKLVEELQPERSLSHNPLFHVMFALQNTAKPPRCWPALNLERLDIDTRTSKFDLSLILMEDDDDLVGAIEYGTELFDSHAIARMRTHFTTLLQGIVSQPQQRLSKLPVLTVGEHHQILAQWNDTRADWPADKCIHHLFEQQVQATPDAPAVVFQDIQLTYRELDSWASQLARELASLGVGPDVPVGLCMRRSLELVASVLAILKAGGAYVPLDPTYPKERLAVMMDMTQLPLLLTQRELAPQLPPVGTQVVFINELRSQLPTTVRPFHREDTRRRSLTPDHLAYIIHTSGSTGIPKGVAMPHRPLVNLIAWQLKNFHQPRPARTLQFSSIGFDVSFQEIFSTWCSGGTLVLIDDSLRQDPGALLRFLDRHAVERIFLPWVALQQLAEASLHQKAVPHRLQEVITAGEQLRVTPQIIAFFQQLKVGRLYNQYGPSEAHVVTSFLLNGLPNTWPALPPIGRPIDNCQIYLLDADHNPVPVGVPGDLYIGGCCLARGYMNQPHLTADRFVPYPFPDQPGARLYKTGDRARYGADGVIEFLGRTDQQVKIRAYRVELGEVECALEQHPAVRQCAVVAWSRGPGDQRLAAYVVARTAVTSADLRRFLEQKLPNYMVPSACVFLDALPLTPSGKLNRRALPSPEETASPCEDSLAAPRTRTEELLCEIWRSVLGLRQLGVHDNFFELGGHSLLVTQILSRVREQFQVELPPRSLFEAPTVAQLAKTIESTFLSECRRSAEKTVQCHAHDATTL